MMNGLRSRDDSMLESDFAYVILALMTLLSKLFRVKLTRYQLNRFSKVDMERTMIVEFTGSKVARHTGVNDVRRSEEAIAHGSTDEQKEVILPLLVLQNIPLHCRDLLLSEIAIPGLQKV